MSQTSPALQKPIISESYLTLQRIYTLSNDFGWNDPYGDLPVNERLSLDDTVAWQYTSYLNALYELIGIDHSPLNSPTVNCVRTAFQSWWESFRSDDQQRIYVAAFVDRINYITSLDNFAIAYRPEDIEKREPDWIINNINEKERRHLWAIETLMITLCGQSFSSVRDEVHENPFLNFNHPLKDFYSINILEHTPTVDYSNVGGDDSYGEVYTHKNCLITTSLGFAIKNIQKLMADRIDFLKTREINHFTSIRGLELCKNNEVFAVIRFKFLGDDYQPWSDRDFNYTYKRYHRLGINAYDVSTELSRLTTADTHLLSRLRDHVPHRYKDLLMEHALATDLGL